MRIGRLTIYIWILIAGLGLFFGGIQYFVTAQNQTRMSDEAVKERARELGMVELKEAFQQNESEESQ